jgi:hypothetical protein
MLATRTSEWMILPKDSLVSSGGPIVQSKGLVIAMLMFKEVGKTVYAAKRVWMLMPAHLLPQRQRLVTRSTAGGAVAMTLGEVLHHYGDRREALEEFERNGAVGAANVDDALYLPQS